LIIEISWTPSSKNNNIIYKDINLYRIVAIDPDQELRFQLSKSTDPLNQLKAYLQITNVSTGNLAYKVKTTAPKHYVVKPNQGILDKGQKIVIDISLIHAPVILSLLN